MRLPARAGDGGARQGRAAPAATAAATASANAGIVGDQDGLRRLVVLGLGQQVDGDVARIVRGIGQHDDLGRAGDGVDADPAEHLPLGLGDIGVAGADDAIDRRDGRGAVGQRRDRLGAADPVDLGHAGAARRGQHQRVQHAVRGRHAHRDARHAGDPGRDRVHQHRGRIGRLAARHVEADRIQRRPAHAEGEARRVGRPQIGGSCARWNASIRVAARSSAAIKLGRDAGDRRVDLVGGDAQPVGGQRQPVEARGVVAAAPHRPRARTSAMIAATA